VRDLLEANTQTGELEGRLYRFTVPSVRHYPFQWFWDSCFHAIVWSRFDAERAADELRALLAVQEADGLIPHVVFWKGDLVSRLQWHHLESRTAGRIPFHRTPHTTAQMQPPVLAQAVERVVDAGANGFLAEALPHLERYYRYLAALRDPDGDGLISIVSQFESGLDFSPVYDEAIGLRRPTPTALLFRTRLPQLRNKVVGYDEETIFRRYRHHLEDVLVNAVYAQGLRALARLAARADREATARWALRMADGVTASLLERSWDERLGLFVNLAGPDERRSRVRTIHGLMPLILPDLPSDTVGRLVHQLEDPRRFGAPWPVSSVALDEPTFLRDHRLRGYRFIWRGPLSLNTNWFLVHGLRTNGYDDLAERIAARSREAVHRGGLNEFYDPLDGRPVGAERFGWATLVADM
jgi:Mannosylglycerate hydrolase MGH1-like glycoside hydrolase domain